MLMTPMLVLAVAVHAQTPLLPQLPPAPAAPVLDGDRPEAPPEPVEVLEVLPVDAPADTKLVAKASLAAQLDRHLTPPELLRDFNGTRFFASSSLDRGTKPYIAFTSEDRATTKIVPA